MGKVTEHIEEALKHLSGALLDAWVVVDREQNVLDFSPAFRALFPRSVARQLRRRTLDEVISLELAGQPLALGDDCMSREMPLRYDEVVGRVAEGDRDLSLIAAAAPLVNEMHVCEGAFITLRNVTDEAQVQVKYKSVLEEEARERDVLQQRIVGAEAELVDLKDVLAGTEKELLDYKKGLLI